MNQSNQRDINLMPAASISPDEAAGIKACEGGAGIPSPGGGGIESEIRHRKAKRWQDDNAAGFAAWNAYVERNGVPLAKYRKFATAADG
nr:type II toxin-antitoxin system CcdA family antitoxin [uncultured Rhodopila sp.]